MEIIFNVSKELDEIINQYMRRRINKAKLESKRQELYQAIKKEAEINSQTNNLSSFYHLLNEASRKE